MSKLRIRFLAACAIPVLVAAASFAPATPAADAAMRGDLAALKALVLQGPTSTRRRATA